MEQNVKQNMEMVKQMMEQAQAEKKADTIRQGNKAHIPVDIDYTADSGEEYKGTIIFRRPSSMDYVRIGAIKSDMLRLSGVKPIVDPQTGTESMAHVDNGIMFLLTALATNRVLLVESPTWFNKYEEIFDTDLVIHVYNRFDAELLSFRRQPKNGPTGSGETISGPESMDSAEVVRG